MKYILILTFILIGVIALGIAISKARDSSYQSPEKREFEKKTATLNKRLKQTAPNSKEYAEILYQLGCAYVGTLFCSNSNEMAFSYFCAAAMRNHSAAAYYAGYTCCNQLRNQFFPVTNVNLNDTLRTQIREVVRLYNMPSFLGWCPNRESFICGVFFYAKSHVLGYAKATEELSRYIKEESLSQELVDDIIKRVRSGRSGL